MHAVIPGLHNGHLHSGLLRGTAESMALWEWLENHVDPAHRGAHARDRPRRVVHGVHRGGARRHDVGARHVAVHGGLGARRPPTSASGPRSCPTAPIATTTSRRSRRTAACSRRTASPPTAGCARGSGWSTSSTARRRCSAAPRSWQTSSTPASTPTRPSRSGRSQECLRQFGRRPIEEMYQRGILGPSTVIAHGVWLDDREVELMAQTGTAMTHCPCSNMKLSSGAARIGHYRAARRRLRARHRRREGEQQPRHARGDEVRLAAAEGQHARSHDRRPVGHPRHGDALGARALGLADVTGSLEVGKDADVVTVDLRGLHFVPVLHGADFNVAAHLVFTASGHDVRDVWVQGHRVVADGACRHGRRRRQSPPTRKPPPRSSSSVAAPCRAELRARPPTSARTPGDRGRDDGPDGRLGPSRQLAAGHQRTRHRHRLTTRADVARHADRALAHPRREPQRRP